MGRKSEHKEGKKQPKAPPPFHKRFNIEVDLEEVKKRFLNRIQNQIEAIFPSLALGGIGDASMSGVLCKLASILGEKYEILISFDHYFRGDFYQRLRAVEALHQALPVPSYQGKLDKMVQSVISENEIDLGIQWRAGVFWPSGAKLLDEALVNEPLQWLSDLKYQNVIAPFEKGLRHFMEAPKHPERLADTVTDMYEALEAMAKVATGRPDKDLSGNRKLFVKKLGLSDYYKRMLKDYISYANEFRHAVEEDKERKPPLAQEVEAFIYTTGLFIRLAIERLNTQKSVSP